MEEFIVLCPLLDLTGTSRTHKTNRPDPLNKRRKSRKDGHFQVKQAEDARGCCGLSKKSSLKII
jgi:hypothetical protein